ncbi:MAG: hypothetical protein ABIZ81_02130 [Opitutaceae bacterium]
MDEIGKLPRSEARRVRPKVTIYRDGLGRAKEREKVLTLLESLAADQDKDALAQLTALRASEGRKPAGS